MPNKLDPCHYTDQHFGSYTVISSREIKGGNICYFAGHSWFWEYPEYVFYYLEKIIETGFDIIFISSSEIGPVTLGLLQNTCAVIIQKENKGVDFGAWKIALEITSYAKDSNTILLANDSVMGPFSDLKPIIEKFRASGLDFYGLTNSFQRNEHIQSYFILANNNVLVSDAWNDFWETLQCYSNKDDIIDNYEIFFTKKLQSAGFRYGVWSDWKELSTREALGRKIFKNATFFRYWGPSFLALGSKFNMNINPCAFFWEELITQLNFPFLKRELVIYKKLNIEYDVLKKWKSPVSKTGYEINLISQILSLGEITTITKSFPFNDKKFAFHYYHAAGESQFSNFALIFGEKTVIDKGSTSRLTIKEFSSGRELLFHFIYLTEEGIDSIIGGKEAITQLIPATNKNTYNLILPYSDDVIPYLQSLSLAQTAIFRKFDEYESAMLGFIQQVIPNTGNLGNIYSPAMIKNVIDISDLKNVVILSSPTAPASQDYLSGEPENFFSMLNRYHREYEALPMWYKKIGQLFKIAMGHKIIKWEVKNKRIKMVLKHKITVNEHDKPNFIKNWYHHEYDVLPGWYKRFGKLINKNK